MIELTRNELAEIDRLASPANIQKAAINQAVLYGIAIGVERAAAMSEKLWRAGYRGDVNVGFAHAIRGLLRA